ncbi:unnamed protein product, partial [marine sediment metagenome]
MIKGTPRGRHILIDRIRESNGGIRKIAEVGVLKAIVLQRVLSACSDV